MTALANVLPASFILRYQGARHISLIETEVNLKIGLGLLYWYLNYKFTHVSKKNSSPTNRLAIIQINLTMQPILSIVFVVDTLASGGAGRQVAIVGSELARRGHRVTICTTNQAEGPNYYECHPEISQINIKVQSKLNNTLVRMIDMVYSIIQLRKIFKKRNPNLVISFLPGNNFRAGIAATGLGLPLIACERNYMPARLRASSPLHRLFYYLMSKLLYPRTAALCVQTKHLLEWLSKKVPGHDIKLIPNVVVEPSQKGSEQLIHFAPKRKSLLFVGRMVEQKRVGVLINAFSKLADTFLELDLVLVGDGDQKEALEAQVIQQGIQHRVFFTGHVKDVRPYFRNASIFVLPSRFEGFPNALSEAMSMGVPSICFDILAGTKELSNMGERAMLLPNLEPETELAQGIKTLLDDPEHMSALSKKAKSVAVEFSTEKVVAKWESLARNYAKHH